MMQENNYARLATSAMVDAVVSTSPLLAELREQGFGYQLLTDCFLETGDSEFFELAMECGWRLQQIMRKLGGKEDT